MQKHIAKINGTHSPSLVSSPMDAINHTTKMINEEKLGLHEVDDYIKTTYAAVPGHGKIIATIKRQFTHRDETLYTSKDIKKFLMKKNLGTAGKIVNGVAHFACKEGYEDRHFMNCLKIWDEKGVSSHIHGYTKGSTDRHNFDEKLHTVLDDFDRDLLNTITWPEWIKLKNPTHRAFRKALASKPLTTLKKEDFLPSKK